LPIVTSLVFLSIGFYLARILHTIVSGVKIFKYSLSSADGIQYYLAATLAGEDKAKAGHIDVR